MSEPIRVGDVVQLKTGGPSMIVADAFLVAGERVLACEWTVGFDREHGEFEEKNLRLVRRNY